LRPFVEAVLASAENVDGVQAIPMHALDTIAAEFRLSRKEAELAALEAGVLPRRYMRSCGTIGIDGQLTLLRSAVAIIGLGGLGGFVAEGLARAGVGHLTLVDGDVFCDHNLNRQVLCCESNLGRAKAKVAAERVHQVNCAVEVRPVVEFATCRNLAAILSGVNVVVDALDRLPTRLVLQRFASEAGVPMVHGAIAGWMGQVMTIFPGDVGLQALYGDGTVPEQGVEAELGCPPGSPMMIAAWQINETIKILLGTGELLRGRMLFIDAAVGDMRLLSLE
jgi:molybdopterin/thiamine biosynthesis adenylyltransferase